MHLCSEMRPIGRYYRLIDVDPKVVLPQEQDAYMYCSNLQFDQDWGGRGEIFGLLHRKSDRTHLFLMLGQIKRDGEGNKIVLRDGEIQDLALIPLGKIDLSADRPLRQYLRIKLRSLEDNVSGRRKKMPQIEEQLAYKARAAVKKPALSEEVRKTREAFERAKSLQAKDRDNIRVVRLLLSSA